ncbi:MAG TPA: hypothetical protein VIH42_08550 [Thermoguttaceae bacterium]
MESPVNLQDMPIVVDVGIYPLYDYLTSEIIFTTGLLQQISNIMTPVFSNNGQKDDGTMD